MSATPSQLTILCEDQKTYHFARRYFELWGINRRSIHPKICPPATLSGFDFVIQEYDKEVRTYRQKQNYLNLALVVMVDGDICGLEQRFKQLERQVKREPTEQIAIVIPTRNIETWFEYVKHPDTCDEITNYKDRHRNTKPTDMAEQFRKNVCQLSWRTELIPSLRVACEELRRIGRMS